MKFEDTKLLNNNVVREAFDALVSTRGSEEASIWIGPAENLTLFGEGLEPEFIAASLLIYSNLPASQVENKFGDKVADYVEELHATSNPTLGDEFFEAQSAHVKQLVVAVGIEGLERLKDEFRDNPARLKSIEERIRSTANDLVDLEKFVSVVYPTSSELDKKFGDLFNEVSATLVNSVNVSPKNVNNPKPPKR